MTDEISSLILEHLKAVRADQQIMKSDLRDIKARLLPLEIHQAAYPHRQLTPEHTA
jgi:hypothetical protein